jgi:glycyl-tRNA synthetase alpha chain
MINASRRKGVAYFQSPDARGVISVTERQSTNFRVRDLAKACGGAWLETRRGGA